MYLYWRNFSRARCFFPPLNLERCAWVLPAFWHSDSDGVLATGKHSNQLSRVSIWMLFIFDEWFGTVAFYRTPTSSFFLKTNYNSFVLLCVFITRHCCPCEAKSIIICAAFGFVWITWFARDVTKILKSKPGGLQNFYLLLMKDYLKIYLFTIP